MSNPLLKNETLSHKLISKWFWLYLFAFLTLPLGYIIRVILSNDLSVWEVGIIYSLIGLMSLLSILSSLWLNQQAIVYFLPKYYIEKNNNYITTIYKIVRYINIVMTIIISILFYFFIEYFWNNYIEHFQSKNILYIFLWVFIFLNLTNPLKWVFSSFQDVFIPQLTEFTKQLIISILLITLFILWIWSILNYSIAFLIWAIISYIIIFTSYKYKYLSILNKWKFIKNTSLFKKLLLFWVNALIVSNAIIIINNIDIQMLIIISWIENAWYYTNYTSLVNISMFIIIPIISILFPIISELNSKWKLKEIKKLQNFMYKYFITFSIIISIFLLVFWKILAVILYWQDFLYSWVLLQYLAIFGIFKIISVINFAILLWIWKVKERTKILLSVLIINIVLNLLFIPSLWSFWAWLATSISWLCISIFSFYYVNKNIKINLSYIFYIKNIAIISIIWIICYFIIPYLFILENTYRYENLIYLFLIVFLVFIILILSNIKEYKNISKELKNIKKV
jgi:O-antigen/teichoic acid export membrane protein